VSTSILTSLLGDPIFLVLFSHHSKVASFLFIRERAIIHQKSRSSFGIFKKLNLNSIEFYSIFFCCCWPFP
jgi:hypothetical protein